MFYLGHQLQSVVPYAFYGYRISCKVDVYTICFIWVEHQLQSGCLYHMLSMGIESAAKWMFKPFALHGYSISCKLDVNTLCLGGATAVSRRLRLNWSSKSPSLLRVQRGDRGVWLAQSRSSALHWQPEKDMTNSQTGFDSKFLCRLETRQKYQLSPRAKTYLHSHGILKVPS